MRFAAGPQAACGRPGESGTYGIPVRPDRRRRATGRTLRSGQDETADATLHLLRGDDGAEHGVVDVAGRRRRHRHAHGMFLEQRPHYSPMPAYQHTSLLVFHNR